MAESDKAGASERPYAVGKGKPPRHTQFKKGDPRAKRGGRPRKPSPEEEARRKLKALLQEDVTIHESGRTLKVTAFEAWVRRLRAEALSKGSIKAGREWIELSARYGALFSEPDTAEFLPQDHKGIVARFLARARGEEPPDDTNAPQNGLSEG
jgi:hypothetical protein